MDKIILVIIVFYFFGCKHEQKEKINKKLSDSTFNVEVNYNSPNDLIDRMSLKMYDPVIKDTIYQGIVYDDDYQCFMIQLRTHKTPSTYLIGVRGFMNLNKYKCFYIRYKEIPSFYKDIKPNSTLYTSLDEKSLRKILPSHRGKIITETQYDTLSLGINFFDDLVNNNLIRIENEKYEYINRIK